MKPTDSNSSTTTVQVELCRRIATVGNLQARLVDRLSRVEQLADDVLCMVRDFQDLLLKLGPQNSMLAKYRALAGKTVAQATSRVQPHAKKGVLSLCLERQPDDSVSVQIDFGSCFRLPRLLGELLTLLSADSGVTTDDKVGFKPLSEIATQLGKVTSKHFSRQAITQLVYRLRREFLVQGEDPGLIQTNRRLGGAARFALRRTPTVRLIGSDGKRARTSRAAAGEI